MLAIKLPEAIEERLNTLVREPDRAGAGGHTGTARSTKRWPAPI